MGLFVYGLYVSLICIIGVYCVGFRVVYEDRRIAWCDRVHDRLNFSPPKYAPDLVDIDEVAAPDVRQCFYASGITGLSDPAYQ